MTDQSAAEAVECTQCVDMKQELSSWEEKVKLQQLEMSRLKLQ